MKSATSSTSAGQHCAPWLIERTDTGPQLPRTSRPVTSPHGHRNEQSRPPPYASARRHATSVPGVRLTPSTSTAERNHLDTTPTSSTDPEFNAALEKVLEELAGVNAILADQ